MKKMKQTLALFLAFLMLMTTCVFASEETKKEASFRYLVSTVTFLSQDLARVSIHFYGEAGTTGNIDTECYIPVYDGNNNQLVDVFYLPIHLENPFEQSHLDWYDTDIRITNPEIRDYRFKVIMLDSINTLSPEGKIYESGTNEIIQSNEDHYKFVQFDGKISDAPLHENNTTVSFEILDNVLLFEGATDAGYTEETFPLGTNIPVSTQHYDLYNVQGLYCRVMLNILNDGTYLLWWAAPMEDYNETVSIKPVDLVSAKNTNNEAEYYATETSDEVLTLPLAENVSVYKNYEIASYSEIVPGYNEYITAYRYVDTNMDNLYDTVYIDYEEIFMVGSVNATYNKIYVNYDAMRTYRSTSLQINYDDAYTAYNLNVDFEDIKVGQLVRLKPSYDGMYTRYDITVEDAKPIAGEITNITNDGTTEIYTIDGNEYRMLSTPYSVAETGDKLVGAGFDNVIVYYELIYNANVGVILDTAIDTTFDTAYQIKLITQEGDIAVYNLAEKVNGSTPYFSSVSSMQNSLPKGSVISYRLNENNEIYAYDIQDQYTNNTLTPDDRIISRSGWFDQTTGKLGNYLITADTIIFAIDDTDENVTENNIVVSDTSVLNHNTMYNFGVLYNGYKEAIAVLLYETKIEATEEILSDIAYGVVIDALVSETFETVYTLQLLTQDGTVVAYPLANKLNEKTPEFSAELLVDTFPKGELIAYQLNGKNQIRYIDTLSEIYTGNVLEETQLVSINGVYENSAFGDYLVTSNTTLTGTAKDDATTLTKDDCEIVLKADLIPGDVYSGVGVINASNELIFTFTYNTTSTTINPDSYPFIVTKKTTVPIDGNQDRIHLHGYVNGEEMEFVIAENASDAAKNLNIGDAALYKLNRNSEITDVLVLAKKSENGYTVLDNAINGAYDDARKESNANETFLSTENYTAPNTATEAKAIAEAMMSTKTTDTMLAGFAAAGKGYQISGRILQLINANNYFSTFTGTDRNYPDSYIKDYYIQPDAIAYWVNCNQNKILPTTILDAETEVNTFDFRNADQLDNDDFIYVYNYDGVTKLILIIDVKGN